MAPPELVRAILKDGKVEATFSKEVTAAGLGDAIAVDDASVEWSVSPDGRVGTTTAVLPGGVHHVEFGTGPIDLAGKGLASPIAVDLTVPTGERRDLAGLVVLLFELLNQRELAQSPTGQQASFQGHPVDPETGFVYLRNRYFDPELGRFITADPMGYPDGPSEYAFGAGDVVNGRDPMGLETLMVSTTGESRIIDGRQLSAMLVAEGLHPREADRIVIEAGMGDEINAHVVAEMAPYMRASGKLINRAILSTAAVGISAPLLAGAATTWGLGTLSSSMLVGGGSAIAGQGGEDLADQHLSSFGTYAKRGAVGAAFGFGFGAVSKGYAFYREVAGMGKAFEGIEYAFVDGLTAEAQAVGQGFRVPSVPWGRARFVVDPSGKTRIFLGGGKLEVSDHAAQRITQRGLTLDAVEGVVTQQQPFRYFHEGVWKIGYYDPTSRIFVGTVDDTLSTVINNATPKYIRNLQVVQP